MAVTCTAAALSSAANSAGFQCLPSDEMLPIMAYLLATINGGSTDPAVLLAAAQAAGYQCIEPADLKALMVYLLCQIVNNGGTAQCPQDMQIEWEDASLRLGELLGYQASANMAGITSLTFNQSTLQSNININAQTSLLSVAFPNLTTIAAQVAFASCTNLNSISFPSLSSISGGSSSLVFTSNKLTSISFPDLVGVTLLQFTACSLLTTVSFPVLVPANGAVINFLNSALNQASVDHVLARAVANAAFTSGQIGMGGGTNATPSATGLADKATLIGRGVTVTTN